MQRGDTPASTATPGDAADGGGSVRVGDERTPGPRGGAAATYGLLMAGMALFGSATPVSRLVTEDFPALLAAGLRVALGAMVLVPVMAVTRRRRGCRDLVPRLPARDWLVVAAIAVAGMLLFSVLMLHGMREVSGAAGSVVMGTTPAVTAVAAVLFMGERADPWSASGAVLAVAGVVVVNLFGAVGTGGGGAVWLGVALVFGAVCCEAAYSLLGKRLTGDITPVEVAALAAAAAVVPFIPLMVWEGVGADWSQAPGDWAALVWWGIGTLALGSVVWYSGMRRAAGTTAAAFMGVMPISALLISYALLDEPFRWAHVAGMAVVLAGVAVVVEGDRRRERRQP